MKTLFFASLLLLPAATLAAIGCAEATGSPDKVSSGASADAGAAGTPNSGGTSSSGGSASGGSSNGGTGGIASSCPPGQLPCADGCQPVNTNEHCGGCYQACDAGTTCDEVAGFFECVCEAGTVECGGSCVDPQSNDQYCGATGTCSGLEAGIDCGTGGECVGGSCECISGYVSCDGKCIDNQTDAKYCGASNAGCGIECVPGATCDAGSCDCGSLTMCAAGCFDTSSDAGACGGCVESGGEVCKTGMVCALGACTCSGGKDECDSGCIDTKTDATQCGACAEDGGATCDTGKFETCNNGTCDCPTDWIRCNGYCVDPMNDVRACGGCTDAGGVLCDAGDVCAGGVCASGPCDANLAPDCVGKSIVSASAYFDGFTVNLNTCYEVKGAFTHLRYWWSDWGAEANGTALPYQFDSYDHTLPAPQGGGYCIRATKSPQTTTGHGFELK